LTSTTRTCGECTACCEGWLEDVSLQMRPGKLFKNFNSGTCSIYEDRPFEPCRRFVCGWLQDNSPLKDAMRPDLIGAILVTDRDWQKHPVYRAVPIGQRLSEETLMSLKKIAVQEARPLIHYERRVNDQGEFDGSYASIFGPPDFAKLFQEAQGEDNPKVQSG